MYNPQKTTKNMIKQILCVGIGGAGGSILRFLVSELFSKNYTSSFPLATFSINIVGCFLIGLFAGSLPIESTNLKLLLITGFCGGFTTFSTFSKETLQLISNEQISIAIIYILMSCVIGILATWGGLSLSSK